MNIKKEYIRLRKNLSEKKRYYKKRGYLVSFNVPPTPKEPTKTDLLDLQFLSENANARIYSVSEKGRIIGSVAEGFTYQNINKSISKLESSYNSDSVYDASTVVIRNFLSQAYNFPALAYPLISKRLNEAINENGEGKVAEAILKAQESGLILTSEIAYEDSLLNEFMDDVLTFLDFSAEEKSDIVHNEGDTVYELYNT